MANAIDEELKRQARMLGLGQWRPDAEDEVRCARLCCCRHRASVAETLVVQTAVALSRRTVHTPAG